MMSLLKLNIQSRRDSVLAAMESFLSELKSEPNPELARIVDYSINDGGNAGNTLALFVRVQTASSLGDIVLQTEIGEGTV